MKQANARTEKPKAVSSNGFVLLPSSELKRMLCKCGTPMGEDGHVDVYDLDGKIAVAEVRCAKCEEALASVVGLKPENDCAKQANL